MKCVREDELWVLGYLIKAKKHYHSKGKWCKNVPQLYQLYDWRRSVGFSTQLNQVPHGNIYDFRDFLSYKCLSYTNWNILQNALRSNTGVEKKKGKHNKKQENKFSNLKTLNCWESKNMQLFKRLPVWESKETFEIMLITFFSIKTIWYKFELKGNHHTESNDNFVTYCYDNIKFLPLLLRPKNHNFIIIFFS